MTNKEPSSIHPYWIDFSDLYKRADDINHAYHSGNLVFFLGSGASKAYCSTMPDWEELLQALLMEVRLENTKHKDEVGELINKKRYSLAAEALKKYGSFNTDNNDLAIDTLVAKVIRQRIALTDKYPLLHLAILDFSTPIFTTNYDTTIENLIADYKVDGYRRTAITYEDQEDSSILLSPSRFPEKFVYKLHGSIEKTQRLILDEKDYSDFYFHARWPTSLQLLRHILATKMVVFIGYSLSDPDIAQILREATRYASSYQHLALMKEGTLQPIEKDLMQKNFRVDPILYKDYNHLPLFVMEMRNFYNRTDLALQLKPERNSLIEVLSVIKKKNYVQQDCSTILFGSFAKYGDLAQPEADIDILFLTDYSAGRSRIENLSENKFRKPIDATVMSRSEFERLLRDGDSFASSVLVTGCPLDDPKDQYGILCRGFKGNYEYGVVLQNARIRYQMRWLRLCIYRNTEGQQYLQVCHQWAITLMQFFVIKNYYPLDSLLAISLLGNARFVIREFANRFKNFEEDYFISLMQQAKGILLSSKMDRPSIQSLSQKFLGSLQDRYHSDELDVLIPSNYISKFDVTHIIKLYHILEGPLTAISEGKTEIAFGYGVTNVELSFLEKMAEAQKITQNHLTTFDILFFFHLQDLVKKEGNKMTDKRLEELCHNAQKRWQEEFFGKLIQ